MCARTKKMWDGSTSRVPGRTTALCADRPPPLKTLRAKSHNDVTVWHSKNTAPQNAQLVRLRTEPFQTLLESGAAKHSTTDLLVTRSNTAGVLNHWVGVGFLPPLDCFFPGGETHLAWLAIFPMTELWSPFNTMP